MYQISQLRVDLTSRRPKALVYKKSSEDELHDLAGDVVAGPLMTTNHILGISHRIQDFEAIMKAVTSAKFIVLRQSGCLLNPLVSEFPPTLFSQSNPDSCLDEHAAHGPHVYARVNIISDLFTKLQFRST